MKRITPFLWFDGTAEQAMQHYTSVFPNSEVLDVTRAGPNGPVFSTSFRVEGQELIAFNGGPHYTFNEAISLFVSCETQAEVDELWEKLGAGGEPGRCGWLKDRFGVSWQIIPRTLGRLLMDPDPERARRVHEAMMKMGKIDIAALQRACEGG